MFRIRPAALPDAAELLSIYSYYVLHSPATFEYDPPSLAGFSSRMDEVLGQYPYLVCELDGHIAGYACAHRFHERAAYQWDVELTIYLHPGYRGRGIGTALYTALFALLSRQNIYNLYALITSPNPGSEALHQKLGFQMDGFYRKSGYKNGSWYDVKIYRKSLVPDGGFPNPPKPFIPYRNLDEKVIAGILKNTF